ncbi:MAG: PQQ-dependent sugar dehydrogenase, partial [Chloroflexota bacterium]
MLAQRISRFLLILLVMPFGLASSHSLAAAAPTSAGPPPGFADSLVASLSGPTALAFTPDGRLLITTQTGALRVYASGSLLATPALDLSAQVCTNNARGLLGVAIDPNFTSNHFIYLYYTFKKSGSCVNNSANSPVNRASRFTLPDSNVIDPASELVLIDNIPSPNANHNAGDLHFGKDGYLYISVGDGGCDYADSTKCSGNNDAARDQHILLGKILRITSSGGIPVDNPFLGANTARCNVTGRTDPGKRCQETFAWGLRNPFRMAFDPNASATRFYINDVGQGVWEEVDLGQAGADYGWNVREGHCANNSSTNCGPPPAGMTNPIYDYQHGTGCKSITGGAFVPNGVWPSAYDNSYLYGDYVCGRIFQLKPNGSGGYTVTSFATGLGASSAVHLTFGPDGASQSLYYTTYTGGGQVRRVAYTATDNRSPVAVISASPAYGPLPLTVNFDGSASSDADGNPITYEWNFGDGATGSGVSPSHTYTIVGNYTATLRVRDNLGAVSDPATLQISVGNTPPLPAIASPPAGLLFSVGQAITLTGSAADAEEGALPDSRLSWRVILHHNDHTHPFLPPTAGNNLALTAPAPEDLDGTAASYVEIELTATDSQGLSAVITQELRPHLVDITFETVPTGFQLTVNSQSLAAPQTVTSWEAYALNVNAPMQTDGNGQVWVFLSWSYGGPASHTIVTPATPAAYTATLTHQTPGAPSLLSPTDGVLVTNYSPLLDWRDSNPPTDHYQIQIAADATFNTILYDETATASNYTPAPPLTPNTTYYWRVRAFSPMEVAASQWSPVRSFRTVLLSPALNMPSGNSLMPALRPVFDWNNTDGATSYTLQIASNQNFNPVILSLPVTPSAYLMLSDLPRNTLFFWRVRANGLNGPSAWSRVRHFHTGSPPGLPAPLTPTNNATVTGLQPTLDWADSSPTAEYYEVQISTDANFSRLLGRGQGGRVNFSSYTPQAPLTHPATRDLDTRVR